MILGYKNKIRTRPASEVFSTSHQRPAIIKGVTKIFSHRYKNNLYSCACTKSNYPIIGICFNLFVARSWDRAVFIAIRIIFLVGIVLQVCLINFDQAGESPVIINSYRITISNCFYPVKEGLMSTNVILPGPVPTMHPTVLNQRHREDASRKYIPYI